MLCWVAKMHSWNWDDLRFVLCLAEQKTLVGAARVIGVNHTTVLRRVAAFEKENGVRIFDRMQTGYELTHAGAELVNSARQAKDIISDLSRRLSGNDLRLEGVLRITTCDTLMGSILPELLAGFSKKYPDILLEITTGNFVSNLAQRDADVAIRTGDEAGDSLVGRRIGDVRFGVYGQPDLARGFSANSPTCKRWVVPDFSLGSPMLSQWLRGKIGDGAIAMKADSLFALRQAAEAGLGLVLLPCYLGDTSSKLRKIAFDGLEGLTSGLWVLTHQDLRSATKVSAFTSFAASHLKQLKPLFEGAKSVSAEGET